MSVPVIDTEHIEKALLPADSQATLNVQQLQERASYLSFQSTVGSYVSTIDGRTLHKDSVISLNSPTQDKFKLDPITELSSTRPTPRLSVDGQNVILEDDTLPLKTGTTFTRWLRWTFFSYYRRLFTIVFIGNMISLVVLLTRPNNADKAGFAGITYSSTIDAASINLLVAILARNEHVVNLFFRVACSVPMSTPLWFRRRVAKVYSYGGLHSGCGVAAVIWYIVFAGLVARHIAITPFVEPAIAALTFVIIALLLAIVIFAHPKLRQKLHNWFESTHRFAGWTIVALFWAQVVLTAYYSSQAPNALSTGRQLIQTPAFWCLIIISFCIVYSWARLRSREVRAEPLSSHAIRLHFKHSVPTYCMGVRVTDSPLRETHAFATIPYFKSFTDPSAAEKALTPAISSTITPPTANNNAGFSILISRAGDWTTRIIQNPPQKLWFRGAPTLGVLRVATLFSPCVIVTTGSGIGPCLSLFNGYSHASQRGRPTLDIRILWSTPAPTTTYGQGIIDEVHRADAGARIIDTRTLGKDENGKPRRPDMVMETWRLVREARAEGVVVISNPVVTRKVVYGLESRGIAACGVIFDS